MTLINNNIQHLIEFDPINNDPLGEKYFASFTNDNQNNINVTIESSTIPETGNNNKKAWNNRKSKKTVFLMGDSISKDFDVYIWTLMGTSSTGSIFVK